MPSLWSMSTTVRNSNRVRSFIRILSKMDGRVWDRAAEREYQILLIQYKAYHPKKVLHPLMLKNVLTFNDAEIILDAQNYVEPSMRGRQSINPLKKLGLVEIDQHNRINITPSGWNVINGTLGLETPLVEWKFTDCSANIKPYVATLHFIRQVDIKLNSKHGISFDEFGFFVMTLNHYTEITNSVNYMIQARNNPGFYNQYRNYVEKSYDNYYNFDDYLDNNIRYLNQSDLLDINNRVRLNYNRIQGINNIIGTDDSRAY